MLVRKSLGPPLQAIGHRTGLMRAAARWRGVGGALVLMYHSVADEKAAEWLDPRNHVPAAVFERQIRFLAEHRRVVSMSELIDRLHRGERPERGAVVITFDDGYRDNLTVAAPILGRFGLPATLFLPTGYIDRAETQWVDQAWTMFKTPSKHSLTLHDTDQPAVFDLSEPTQKRAAYERTCAALMSATLEQRRQMLDDLHDQLAPREEPPRLTLNWDEVRALRREHDGFEIGGHTAEHRDLSACEPAEAEHELATSRRRIEDELGRPPRHFSFPYGRTSEALRGQVAEAGFISACGSGGLGEVVIQAGADPFRLPRIEAPASDRRFDLLTDSANTGLWRKLGR